MSKCTFSDVSERDMDLLFLEEFVCSPDFLNIFLSKINLTGASVIEVEHSKTDVEFGESDMTVIVEKDGQKFGILIEDKIDAIAMRNQSARYKNRGEIGRKNGDYVDYFVFIVAPQKYLDENEEAKKYPNQITYEQCLEYFRSKTAARSIFKAQQIEQAIYKQKHGYQVVENTSITSFWQKYASYQKEHYPELIFKCDNGPRGSKSTSMIFHTYSKKIKIYHKSNNSCVDLEFSGLGEKTAELKSLLISTVGSKLWCEGLQVYQTGKSAVLRIQVPKIDVKANFDDYKYEVDKALSQVKRLYSILDDIPVEKLQELFNDVR